MTLLRAILVLSLVGALPSALAAPTPSGGALRPARGRLLVAGRDLPDPNFARAVILLVEYQDDGAMGVIVNRRTPRTLEDLRPQVETERSDPIYLGGPVLLSSLLVLTRTDAAPSDAVKVFGDVHVLTSRTAVDEAFASTLPARRLRFYAGHAGWGPGQLDAELKRGDWFVMPATTDVVFSDTPDDVWERLVERTEGEWTRAPGSAPETAEVRGPLLDERHDRLHVLGRADHAEQRVVLVRDHAAQRLAVRRPQEPLDLDE